MKLTEKRYNLFTDIRKNTVSYLLILPAALFTFIFGYLSLPYIYMAFTRFDYRKGLFSSDWVGLKNFEFFFKSQSAYIVTRNTIVLNVLAIIFVTIVAIFFTIMFNEAKNKYFLKFTQSVFILPSFISWVAVSYFVYNIFSTQYGVVNKTLEWFGLQPVNWYSEAGPWTWIITGIRIWKDTGMKTVIFLAAVSGIDKQLYEAATIDGATRLQQNKSITIPLLMPTAAIITLLSLGKLFYGDFGMIYSIIQDNGVLFPTTDVIDTYVFRALRKLGDPCSAMAVGLFQAFVGFLLVYFSNMLTRKFFREGALY